MEWVHSSTPSSDVGRKSSITTFLGIPLQCSFTMYLPLLEILGRPWLSWGKITAVINYLVNLILFLKCHYLFSHAHLVICTDAKASNKRAVRNSVLYDAFARNLVDHSGGTTKKLPRPLPTREVLLLKVGKLQLPIAVSSQYLTVFYHLLYINSSESKSKLSVASQGRYSLPLMVEFLCKISISLAVNFRTSVLTSLAFSSSALLIHVIHFARCPVNGSTISAALA